MFLTVKKNDQLIVARRCELARRIGIHEGSTLSLAKAFLPHAVVHPLSSLDDFKKLYRLAAYHYRYTPIIGLDPEAITFYKDKKLDSLPICHFGVNLDLTGTERLYPDDRRFIKELSDFFLKLRIEARFALAPRISVAWALSRFAPERVSIVTDTALQAALTNLPIAALRIDPQAEAGLRSVGLLKISNLLSVPRKNILERYGKGCLKRLDQFTGEMPETIEPIQIPHTWRELREFEVPLQNHDAICSVILELVVTVLEKLIAASKLAKQFDLFILGRTVIGEYFRLSKEFTLYSPTTDSKHLLAVITPLVEGLKIPGGISTILLTAKQVVKHSPTQKDFNADDEVNTDKEELLNFFVSGLGDKRVTRVEFTQSYLPEHSFAFVPVSVKGNGNTDSKIEERPSVILESPQPIKAIAMLPDSHPVKLFWKDEELKISSGIGPERLERPWYEDRNFHTETRDYFKVQDQKGRWLWVYRNVKSQEWFIQGLWI